MSAKSAPALKRGMINAKLPFHRRAEIYDMASGGASLSLKELAVATGRSYTKVRSFAKRPGFPLVLGRVTRSDFEGWAKGQPDKL